ncbi:MAG: hypothetical protein ACREP9_05120 [Candidatus Dormibacteraceae bacterium]
MKSFAVDLWVLAQPNHRLANVVQVSRPIALAAWVAALCALVFVAGCGWQHSLAKVHFPRTTISPSGTSMTSTGSFSSASSSATPSNSGIAGSVQLGLPVKSTATQNLGPNPPAPGPNPPAPGLDPPVTSAGENFEQTVRDHIALVNRMDWVGAFGMLGPAMQKACANDPEVYHNSAWNGVTAAALSQPLSFSEPDKKVTAIVRVTLSQGNVKEEKFDFFYDTDTSIISGMEGPT